MATILVILLVVGAFLLHAKAYVDSQVKKYNNRIFNDVYIEKLNVSGMTKDEASKILSNHINTGINNRKINLAAGDMEQAVSVSAFKIEFDADKAVSDAYGVGRSGSLISRYFLYRKIEDEPQPVTIRLARTMEPENVEKVVKSKAPSFEHAPVNASLKVTKKEGNNVVEVVKEKNGQKVVVDKAVSSLEKYLDKKWNLETVTFKMPVEVDKPEYTSDKLENITDVLGTYTTKFDYYSRARKENIESGAKNLNGTIISKDNEYSVYKNVRKFFKLDGEKGISQFSSTLYNAAIRAELDITERHAGTVIPGYVPMSADAIIAGSKVDLKFKNNSDNLIYIYSSVDKDKVTITIYGKEYREPDRKVKFTTKTKRVIKPLTTTVKDKKLKKGKKVVDRKGVNGYEVELWKTVTVGGETTENTKFNESTYNPISKVVRVGTKVEKKKKAEDKNKDADNNDKKKDKD